MTNRQKSMEWWYGLTYDDQVKLIKQYSFKPAIPKSMTAAEIEGLWKREALPPFNPENCQALQSTCKKIDSILNEAVDGNLMLTQTSYLADLIKEFANNPLVAKSGVIEIKPLGRTPLNGYC